MQERDQSVESMRFRLGNVFLEGNWILDEVDEAGFLNLNVESRTAVLQGFSVHIAGYLAGEYDGNHITGITIIRNMSEDELHRSLIVTIQTMNHEERILKTWERNYLFTQEGDVWITQPGMGTMEMVRQMDLSPVVVQLEKAMMRVHDEWARMKGGE